MNCWVISPNVWNEKDWIYWKDWILEENKIAVGRGPSDDSGGKQFAKDITIGDIVLVAHGANWQKDLFLAGIVSSESVENKNSDEYYQWRQLNIILKDNELKSLNIKFSAENAYGASNRIPALYRLYPTTSSDQQIINTLKKALDIKKRGATNAKLPQTIGTIQKYCPYGGSGHG